MTDQKSVGRMFNGMRAMINLAVTFPHIFWYSQSPSNSEEYSQLIFSRVMGYTQFCFYGMSLLATMSGFLASRSLVSELERKGRISYWKFVARRLLRFYPMMIVGGILGRIIAIDWNLVLFRHDFTISKPWHFIYNLLFVNNHMSHKYQHLRWTYTTNFVAHFIVVIPLLIMFAHKYKRVLLKPWFFATLSLIPLAFKIRFVLNHDMRGSLLYGNPGHDPFFVLYRHSFYRFHPFLMGVATDLFLRNPNYVRAFRKYKQWTQAGVVLVIAIMLHFAFNGTDHCPVWLDTSNWSQAHINWLHITHQDAVVVPLAFGIVAFYALSAHSTKPVDSVTEGPRTRTRAAAAKEKAAVQAQNKSRAAVPSDFEEDLTGGSVVGLMYSFLASKVWDPFLRVSYAQYIFHPIVIAWTYTLMGIPSPRVFFHLSASWHYYVMVYASTHVLSYIFTRFVDEPIARWYRPYLL